MKLFFALPAALLLTIGWPPCSMHAQAISPGQGIDEVEVATVNAVVDKIDLEKRKVTVTFDDGKTKTYKVDKSALNLPQVQVGDHVKMAVTEELVVVVNKPGDSPAAASVGAVSVAPKGSKPGGIMVETTAVRGKVLAIDSDKHKVTFEDPDGKKKTLKVRKTVDLSGLAVGDTVDAVLTESVAIDVTK